MLKTIIYIILILTLLSLEESGLPGKIFLNPYLCLTVFFALSRDKLAIIWPILGGITFDYFSIFRFPVFTLSFIGTFLVIKFISEKIMVLKNVTSLGIFSFGGIFIYNFIFLFLNIITYLFKIENILIIFNRDYFLHIFSNIIFTFFLLLIFRKKYDRSIFYH